jgi:hypothetical protein
MLFCTQKNMKKTILFLFLILFVFLCVSCKKTVFFEQTVVFPNANWAFENKEIVFEVPTAGSDDAYTVILELDLVGTPNVEKFYATFRTLTPHGAQTIKSVYFNFENPKEPFIQGANPNEKIYRVVVYPKRYFSEAGIYKFEIDQYSGRADNYGINALRLRIERVKE